MRKVLERRIQGLRTIWSHANQKPVVLGMAKSQRPAVSGRIEPDSHDPQRHGRVGGLIRNPSKFTARGREHFNQLLARLRNTLRSQPNWPTKYPTLGGLNASEQSKEDEELRKLAEEQVYEWFTQNDPELPLRKRTFIVRTTCPNGDLPTEPTPHAVRGFTGIAPEAVSVLRRNQAGMMRYLLTFPDIASARSARHNITMRHKHGLKDVVWDFLWTVRQRPVDQLFLAVRARIAASSELRVTYSVTYGTGALRGHIVLNNTKLNKQPVLYTAYRHFPDGIPKNGAGLINMHLLPDFLCKH
jgi:hypothetical protein